MDSVALFSAIVLLGLGSGSRLSLATGSDAVGFLHVREGYGFSGSLERTESSCTATLIDETTLVTAAHCVVPFPANRIEFTLDEHPSANKFSPYAQVTELRVHPDYQTSDLGMNDIAVLHLGYGKYGGSPGRFPILAEAKSALGRTARFSTYGYGSRIDHDSTSKRFIGLAYRDERYGFPAPGTGLTLFPAMIGEIICHGDSGGPLIPTGGNSIVGILAGGTFSRDQARCALDAIFTSFTSEIIQWIEYARQQIGGEERILSTVIPKAKKGRVATHLTPNHELEKHFEDSNSERREIVKEQQELLRRISDNEYRLWALSLSPSETKVLVSGVGLRSYFEDNVWPQKVEEIGRRLKGN